MVAEEEETQSDILSFSLKFDTISEDQIIFLISSIAPVHQNKFVLRRMEEKPQDITFMERN
jgi:hypothetical protein